MAINQANDLLGTTYAKQPAIHSNSLALTFPRVSPSGYRPLIKGLVAAQWVSYAEELAIPNAIQLKTCRLQQLLWRPGRG